MAEKTAASSGSESPFAVLGIGPTLDLALVKRAYFTALPRCSPHVDPEGFKRLRAAYDELCLLGRLRAAFIRHPIDAAAELARWRERYEAPLERAVEQARSREADSSIVRRFVEAYSRRSLEEALRLAGPRSETPPGSASPAHPDERT